MTVYENPPFEQLRYGMEQAFDASAKEPLTRESLRSVRRLIVAFVLVSAAISVATLRFRNLFDDEIFSLPFVTTRVSEIVAVAREGDVHPAGMYLLAHLAWRVVPSYRWLNLLPLAILYTGLAVFLLNFVPRLRSRRAVLICLVAAVLHPELLMWSNTLRWYCPWTGLALLAIALFLRPTRMQWRLGWGEAVAGGMLLAAMFYLNYITLLFVPALLAAVCTKLPEGDAKASLKSLALAGGVFLCLIAPQLPTMFAVHLENSRAQRSGIALSTVRLVQALGGSEAYLPWHPLAIAAGIVLAYLLASGAAAILRGGKPGDRTYAAEVGHRSERALLVFSVGFFLLVALTGLGGKPRSAMLLVPALAPVAGIGAAKLRQRYQTLVLVVLGAWSCLGAAHLMGRFGLQKSNMNDRPEQVVSLIARQQGRGGSDHDCGLAVTYDGGLAFSLGQARIPRLMILSPYRGALFAGTLTELPEGCAHPRLYIVESYVSGEPDRDGEYLRELTAAQEFVKQPRSVERLSPDPDARAKRRLSGIAGLAAGTTLPDYRFVVISGEMDRSQMPELRRTLHYFVSGEEVVPDESAEASGSSDLERHK